MEEDKSDINLLKAMGESTRYKILTVLVSGEQCACEIPRLIERSQSNTSMHLSKLHDWGIVNSRRDGKRILYSIKDSRVKKIIEILSE